MEGSQVSPSVFIASIVSNYFSIFENYGIDKKGIPVKIRPTPEEIISYKEWLQVFIKTSVLQTAEGLTVDAVDLLYHEALRTSMVPPYGLLNPSLLKVLNVFNMNELKDIFGESIAEKIFRTEYQVEQ
ncbi:hypothetical protein ApAK_05975 [Thermoplasmatales archaeon AK]|nr:hypothetical protein [Thermoplasmatales archaeon AK]